MLSEENKKSEPFSYREKVRIFMVWCDREDSNLLHLASKNCDAQANSMIQRRKLCGVHNFRRWS